MDEVRLKLSVITAGFIGGIIALTLVRDLTPFRAMFTVLAGTACASYLTPIVLHYSGLSAGMEHALAFVLGVTGMNAIAGFFKLSEHFATSPLSTLKGMEKHKKDE